MTATCTLGGVALTGLRPQGWTLTAGTRPSTRIFELPVADARRVAAKAESGLDLVIESGGARVRVEKLHLLATQPGGRPDTRGLLVGDERALWERYAVARAFNIRRRTGEVRLVGEGRVEARLAQRRVDIAYAAWSLNGSAPYTAREVVESVVGYVARGAVSYSTSARKRLLRAPLIEGLDIEAPGDVAVRRVLDTVGLEVTVDADGTVVVFDPREDADEMRSLFAALGAPIRGTGSIALAERALQRPAKIRIGVQIEGELRFDFQALLAAVDTQSVSRADASAGIRDPRLLDNVLLSSEPSLTVAGTEVGPGTPVEVDEALVAWVADASNPTPATGLGDLDDAIIRAHWLGKWDWLEAMYGIDASGNPNEVWLGRLRALRGGWRSLFRLPRAWLDRMRSVRANRAALLDPETGTRAESPAYTDYVVKATRHGLAKRSSEYHRLGWVVEGYATDLADAKAAPAVVTVLDSDQGLIAVQLRPDPGGEAQELAPGSLDVDDVPSHDVSAAYAWWHAAALRADWNLAIVVSAIMAPGGQNHYFVEVKPDDPAIPFDVGESRGSWYTVLVSGGLATARFAWDDSLADAIVDAWFGFDLYPDSLLSNREEVEALARAQAAAIWDSLRDRLEGSASYGFAPGARVRGNVGSIEHSVAPRGHTTTTVAMRPALAPLGIEHYLPESIQRTLRRLVQP